MCLQIEFTGASVAAGFICELQLQLPEMYEFKKATGHKTYEWTRRFESWLAVRIVYASPLVLAPATPHRTPSSSSVFAPPSMTCQRF